MTIKSITLAGVEGDVEITRNVNGAFVMLATGENDEVCIAAFNRNEDIESRYPKAIEVAKAIYGLDKRGRVAATNSMICSLLTEIERVAD